MPLWPHGRRRSGPDVRPRGGGRGGVSRADPDGHHELRRPGRTGGAEGGRVRRRAARRGRDRDPSLRVRAGPRVGGRALGRRRSGTGPGCCSTATSTSYQRPRRTGRSTRSAARSATATLGQGSGRHEGLRRDAPVAGPGPAACGTTAGAADRAVLHRRRGGRRPQGRRGAGPRPPRRVRGVHRGRRRGGRLQHHRARPADVPDRGRREGDGLDAAHRPRPGGTRVDDQPRQRRHRSSPRRSRGSGPTSGRSG